MGRLAEGALRRHRAITTAALVLLVLLAWAWLASGAGLAMGTEFSLAPFPHRNASAHAMAMGWSLGRALLTFSMWWVMMMAMMLPAAASTILLYARAAAHRAAPGAALPPTAFFLAGYLFAWAFFSAGATALQALFEQAGLLAHSMGSASRWLSGGVLIAAGLYQLSPFKNACLSHCRSPADFLSRHYRPGRSGAWRLGLIHGTYCVGCCWLLMVLLFVGGVMNLAWIAVLTLIVAAEKHLPSGRTIARTSGLMLLAWGAVSLAP